MASSSSTLPVASSLTLPGVPVFLAAKNPVSYIRKRPQPKNSPHAKRKRDQTKMFMFKKYLAVEFSLTYKLNVILKYDFLSRLCRGKFNDNFFY